MNKTELIAAVAAKTQVTKATAADCVNAVFAAITEELAAGNKVSLPGFGSFEPRARAERKANNPRTKTTVVLPSCVRPVFKSGSALKRAVEEGSAGKQ